jgi:hypothetical protein
LVRKRKKEEVEEERDDDIFMDITGGARHESFVMWQELRVVIEGPPRAKVRNKHACSLLESESDSSQVNLALALTH